MIKISNAEYAELIAQRDTSLCLLAEVYRCRDALAFRPDLVEQIRSMTAPVGGAGKAQVEAMALKPLQAQALHRAMCALDNAQSRLQIHFHNGGGTEIQVTESASGEIRVSVESGPATGDWQLAEQHKDRATFAAAYGLEA